MLADHTLAIAAPADAYELKRELYDLLSTVGVSVSTRTFLYVRCPIDGNLIIRGADERISEISTYSKPTPQPKNGNSYDFCLRATPTRQTHPFGRQPAEPKTWLTRRSEELGVEFMTIRYRTSWMWCGKQTRDDKPGFYIPDAVYLGQLRVQDAAKLSNALATGIGRHRAFGFGLLQLF